MFLVSPSLHAWFLFCIFIAEPEIKRIISTEKWFNYVVPFFFLKKAEVWVGQTTLNGEKKEDGRSSEKGYRLLSYVCPQRKYFTP